jgi:hypothetical protein
VQGSNEKEFARRMFEYYTRLFNKYGRPVAAIAIFTGRGKKMPAMYEDRCLWTRVQYEYKTLNIADYPDEDLKAGVNPFAAVLLVAKEVLLSGRGMEEERDEVLLEQKLLMVRLLKDKMAVFGKKKTVAILIFLTQYVIFKKPETIRKFMEQRDQILGEKNTMGIVEQLVQIERQEGVEEGLEQAVRKLLTNSEFSPKKIAELIEVPVALVEKIKKEMSAK